MEEKQNRMFDVNEYMQKLIGIAKKAFSDRLLYEKLL